MALQGKPAIGSSCSLAQVGLGDGKNGSKPDGGGILSGRMIGRLTRTGSATGTAMGMG